VVGLVILGVSTKPCLIGFAEVLSHVIREHPKTLGLVSEIFQPTTCFNLICPLIVAPLSERESPTLDARTLENTPPKPTRVAWYGRCSGGASQAEGTLAISGMLITLALRSMMRVNKWTCPSSVRHEICARETRESREDGRSCALDSKLP